MKIYQAIQEARKLNAWVVRPNGSCFVVGYLPHYKEVTELSPIPVDSDTLHCIPISRRDGTLNVCSIGTSDMSLDIKFDANDLIADYTLAVTDSDKAKIIKQYHEEVGIITNFLTDMPSNIRDAYNDLSGNEDIMINNLSISSDALKLNTTLIRSITGAINNHIRFNGPVKVQNSVQLCNRIMGALEGIINDTMISELQQSIDTDKYVVIEQTKLDRILQRDKSKQIKYLVERLKEVDPEFKQRD